MITHTNTSLRLRVRDRLSLFFAARDPLVVIASVILPIIALLVIGTTIYRRATAPAAVAVPTPGLIIIVATAPAVIVPTQSAVVAAVPPPDAGTVTRRAVVAYAAPEGEVIGAIDAGRSYAIVERYGADWLHADVTGSGLVWLRAADLFGLPMDLADAQPPPAPVYVYLPAPAEPQYQVVNDLPSPPPPSAPADAQRDQAFRDHQAREAAFVAGRGSAPPIPPGVHIPDSSEMPCNCP